MSIPVRIILNENLYLRDPEQTDLGKKIVEHSIQLIDELGLEAFTFKKLAHKINSTEASVYRYFQNKHKLLIYLVSWYWRWLEYLIEYETHNIPDPRQRLAISLKMLVTASSYSTIFPHIDEEALHRIVVAEGQKTLHTKDVVGEQAAGLFEMYESLVKKVAEVFADVNPDFGYPQALAATVIDSASNQIFLAQRLTALTEIQVNDGDKKQVIDYLETLIFGALNKQS